MYNCTVPAETRPTIMEVLVEDDWTSTVTSTPIITPTTGFCAHVKGQFRRNIYLTGRMEEQIKKR
jgi:hypothetical protein